MNIQRTGKTSLQIFVYFIFHGSFICRFLYILRPSSVPRHTICPLSLEAYALIIDYLYLQILHSASESNRNENRERSALPINFMFTRQTPPSHRSKDNPCWRTHCAHEPSQGVANFHTLYYQCAIHTPTGISDGDK